MLVIERRKTPAGDQNKAVIEEGLVQGTSYREQEP